MDHRQKRETAIAVGVSLDPATKYRAKESLAELVELAESAGAVVVETVLQERRRPDAALFLGRGSVERLAALVEHYDADLVVFDEELLPAQLRNLEAACDTKVIDRGELILDIFAQRARSSEGKLQVELAQLEYLLPRLAGKGMLLSRLGAGIGTRGPGETKLETDRRIIRRRVARIRAELRKLERRRALHRRKRKGKPIPIIGLVGYTNAGKSTLFNRLTGSDTPVSSRLFATLDPLIRRLTLPSGQKALLEDTVGFIRKLPHTLVAAFHATLEEAVQADLLLHVIDASHPDHQDLRTSVRSVLAEIGAEDVPVLDLYNKLDLVSGSFQMPEGERGIGISALTGIGIPELLDEVERLISEDYREVEMMIPFSSSHVLASLRETAKIEWEQYREDGVYAKVLLRNADFRRYSSFLVVRH